MVALSPIPAALTPQDRCLLDLLFQRAFDLRAFATAAGLTLPDLLDWLALPHIQACLDACRAAQEQAFEARSHDLRTLALHALSSALAESSGPVERRRAAEAMLRAIGRPRPHQPLSATASPSSAPRPSHRDPEARSPTAPNRVGPGDIHAQRTPSTQASERPPLSQPVAPPPSPHSTATIQPRTPTSAAANVPPPPALQPLHRTPSRPSTTTPAGSLAAAAGAPPRPP